MQQHELDKSSAPASQAVWPNSKYSTSPDGPLSASLGGSLGCSHPRSCWPAGIRSEGSVDLDASSGDAPAIGPVDHRPHCYRQRKHHLLQSRRLHQTVPLTSLAPCLEPCPCLTRPTLPGAAQWNVNSANWNRQIKKLTLGYFRRCHAHCAAAVFVMQIVLLLLELFIVVFVT